MTDTLSYKFLHALEPVRDRLYALAAATESSPANAEVLLQKSTRTLFANFIEDPSLDVPTRLEKSLSPDAASPALPPPPAAMPADVWARLAAAVQVEAAKSNASLAINPDSVLLSPDPLLAPKKPGTGDDPDGFDLSSPSRFMLACIIALFIGITLTIYILTRPTTHPPIHPVATTTGQGDKVTR
jgi:hypothetical protein